MASIQYSDISAKNPTGFQKFLQKFSTCASSHSSHFSDRHYPRPGFTGPVLRLARRLTGGEAQIGIKLRTLAGTLWSAKAKLLRGNGYAVAPACGARRGGAKAPGCWLRQHYAKASLLHAT